MGMAMTKWDQIQAQQKSIIAKLSALATQGAKHMSALDDVNAHLTTLGDSFVKMEDAIKAAAAALTELAAAKGDPAVADAVNAAVAGLTAATSRLDEDHAALSNAVAAVTASAGPAA
jgi:NADH dehydrogenase/NADH:ubiquinone oxidoreductase subunit G